MCVLGVMYITNWRFRRRRRCGKCETGRSKSPILKVCLAWRLRGKGQRLWAPPTLQTFIWDRPYSLKPCDFFVSAIISYLWRFSRRRMYCDRESYQPRYLNQSRMSEHDDREARYWTRKLYEFEANDPDRYWSTESPLIPFYSTVINQLGGFTGGAIVASKNFILKSFKVTGNFCF